MNGYRVIFAVDIAADLARSLDAAAVIAGDMIHEGLAADCKVIDMDDPEVMHTVNLFAIYREGQNR